jgi:hypothetical protein
MSRINDALKEARKAQPRTPTSHFTPTHTADDDRTSPFVWLVPSVIIFLIVAGIFFMAWATAHRTVHSIVGNLEPATNPPVTIQDNPPAPAPAPVPAPVVAEPVNLPVVQGIFYSTKSPTAIVDGKTVGPGEKVKTWRVKQITQNNVILTGPDGKDVKLGMQQ